MTECIERKALLDGWPCCDEPADAYQYVRDFPAVEMENAGALVQKKCRRCGAVYTMHDLTLDECGWTRYSYCNECLSKGIESLVRDMWISVEQDLPDINEPVLVSDGVYQSTGTLQKFQYKDTANRYCRWSVDNPCMNDGRKILLWRRLSPLPDSSEIPAEELEAQKEYEAAVEYQQYCERYEPTYDPETGAM